MYRNIAILAIILTMLAPAATAAPAGGLAQAEKLSVPVSEQCTAAQPQLIIENFESGIGDAAVSGASASADKADPIFGSTSLSLRLSGATQATVKVGASADPLRYTGVVAWVKPSTDGIKVSMSIAAKNGVYTSRSQTLRYSGEALPVYFDFASLNTMSHQIGPINTIIITFSPSSGGTVVLDNVALVDAGYGSFNRAWWDETYSKRYVDQRYQETMNDYLALYTLNGGSEDKKNALIRGMDNIVLSREPDGWVEGTTTGLITAGTIGATLANAYAVLKNDPAMDEKIDVYGDTSRTRRWWIEKSLDQDVKFIDYIFTTDPNSWIVRNQLMEGARATYCAYLATGKASYLDDYRNMMRTIKAGRQDPIGTYPEWTGTYNASSVMFDASYSAVQFSTLLSLAAMGDREYALPMAEEMFGVLENVIDPKTGMVMNLNSSRKDYEGDLRWDDGILAYLGTKENLPGFAHLAYIEYRASPDKRFPDNFHSGLQRYYDLKFYSDPATDNGYRLPLEYPAYSIDILGVSGNVVRSLPATISSDGSIKNPSLTRNAATFVKVNGFNGTIQPQAEVNAYFGDNLIRIEGTGPVTVSDGTYSYQGNANGMLELHPGGDIPTPTPVVTSAATASPTPATLLSGAYTISVGALVVLLSGASAFLLWKNGKIKK